MSQHHNHCETSACDRNSADVEGNTSGLIDRDKAVREFLRSIGVESVDHLTVQGISDDDIICMSFLASYYLLSKELERLVFLSYCCRYHFERLCSFVSYLTDKDVIVVRYNSVASYAIDYLYSACISGWYMSYDYKYVLDKDFFRFLRHFVDSGKIIYSNLELEAALVPERGKLFTEIISNMKDANDVTKFHVLEKKPEDFSGSDCVIIPGCGKYLDVSRAITKLTSTFDRSVLDVFGHNYKGVSAIINSVRSKLMYLLGKQKSNTAVISS